MDTTLISVILLVISTLAGLFKIFYPLVLAKLTSVQFANIQIAIETVMFAAEQIYNQIGQGVEKKEFVKNYIMRKFPNVSEKDIDMLIEGIGKQLGIF